MIEKNNQSKITPTPKYYINHKINQEEPKNKPHHADSNGTYHAKK